MNKKRNTIKIYFIVTFGLPIILGIFIGMAYMKGIDTSVFTLV